MSSKEMLYDYKHIKMKDGKDSDNVLKVFEMFAGYGGTSFALKKLNTKYEIVGYSEIDKYAIKCFEQNHFNKDFDSTDTIKLSQSNYGDCTKIIAERLPDIDLLTGGYPCQSFSGAGKMKGELDSRGLLVYDIIRIAKVKQPKYMLLENVKGFTFKKFKETFNRVLSELDKIGYSVYWKVLNSKDYGIPQNRERVWFVCIRKDIKKKFIFPEKEELRLSIKDILEKNVDEKYYLTNKQLVAMSRWKSQENPLNTLNSEISKCLRARGQYGLHSGLQLIKEHKSYISIKDKKGRFNTQDNRISKPNMYSSTIGAISRGVPRILDNNNRIRKLTPKECFRLMGFLNDEINLNGIPEPQKTKLAGNGWDINIASKIIHQILKLEK